jgi:hypothetical protein
VNNSSTGYCATVAGGYANTAGGQFSFAGGQQSRALHNGSFVWADTSGADFTSTAPNQFLIRAAGGVGIGTPAPAAKLHLYSTDNPTTMRIQSTGTPGFGRIEFVSNPQGDINEWRPSYIQSTDNGGFNGGLGFFVNGAGNKFGGVEVMRLVNGNVGIGTNNPSTLLQVGNATCNGTAWANASDRNLKENFKPADPAEVLAKVTALPIQQWSYKSQPGDKHLGPVAQDFHDAFGLGADDKHIATVDADGVALAAIQGLNQKLESELKRRDAENAELKRVVDELKAMVQQLATK